MSLQIAGANISESTATAEHALGSQTTVGNTTYQYVQAASGSTIVAYDFVYILPEGHANEHEVNELVTSGVTTFGFGVGCAQNAIAAGEYGWVAVKGEFTGNVLASCAALKPIYTSATAGSVDDTVGSNFLIAGLFLGVAQGGSPGGNTSFTATNYMTVPGA